MILLPGLGDALKTVKGTALPFAWMYRRLGRAFRVYVFSRRNHLPSVYTSREMAAQIPDSALYMYEELGHGLYEEAGDFRDRVIAFLKE